MGKFQMKLLFDHYIEPADFCAVKMESDREITVLECKIIGLRSNIMSVGEVEKLLDSALKKLPAIEKVYCKSALY